MVKVLIFFPLQMDNPKGAANTVTLSDCNIVKLRTGGMDKHFFDIHPNNITVYYYSLFFYGKQ